MMCKDCAETETMPVATGVLKVEFACFVQNKQQREFFVKWQDMSYWHCDWISELAVSS